MIELMILIITFREIYRTLNFEGVMISKFG